MNIKNGFELNDEVSGLKISVIKGITMDRLHIEHIGDPMVRTRDLYFNKDGSFDGTSRDTIDNESLKKTAA